MKKILSTVLAMAMIVLAISAVFTVSAADDWSNRVVGGPYQQYTSLTSVAGGEVATASGSAAYVKQPVGKTAFKVAFKLDVESTNRMEGEDGYMDNFLSIWLDTKADIDANFGALIDTCNTGVIDKHFRVTKKHLQAVKDPADGNTLIVGIADFGTDDAGWVTMDRINDTGYVQMFLEAVAGEDSNIILTLTAVNAAGETKSTVSFDMLDTDAYMAGDELYLCFGLFNDFAFEVFDVEVMESDIEGAVGKRSDYVMNKIVLEDGSIATPLMVNTVISSMNAEGAMASWGTAAAYTGVLGDKAFKASFDLVWKSTTNDRNTNGSYSALGIYLSDTNEFPADVTESTCLPLTNWFEITDRHLELKDLGSNTATDGFQDFGGDYTVLGTDVEHHVVMELKDGKLSLTMLDKTWTLNYASVADGGKYLGFALQGPAGVPVVIKNFDLIESDVESALDRTAGVEFFELVNDEENTGSENTGSENTGSENTGSEGTGSGDKAPATGVASMAIPALLTAISAAAVCVKTKKN